MSVSGESLSAKDDKSSGIRQPMVVSLTRRGFVPNKNGSKSIDARHVIVDIIIDGSGIGRLQPVIQSER